MLVALDLIYTLFFNEQQPLYRVVENRDHFFELAFARLSDPLGFFELKVQLGFFHEHGFDALFKDGLLQVGFFQLLLQILLALDQLREVFAEFFLHSVGLSFDLLDAV